MTATTIAAAVAALTLTACGSTDAGTVESDTVRNVPQYTEADIAQALDLGPNPGYGLEDFIDTTPSGCEISVALVSAGAVALYAEAGDTVVTTPDGEAGVKASSTDPACLDEFERGLARMAQR